MTRQSSQRGDAPVISVDVGGTFTDIVIEFGGKHITGKVLTDVGAPERGVLRGVTDTMRTAGLSPSDFALFLHGTTLATNALIERKGARTALLTTDGFRDSLEIGYENRFAQYDLFIEKATPLVPRTLRYTVPERILAGGAIDTPLDEEAVLRIADRLVVQGVESVAVGFMHSYINGDHERRAGELLRAHNPSLAVTLSCEVCPEIREYERFTTATANAYVQPLMRTYLEGLERQLAELGFACPILLMTSGGGLTTIAAACQYPIRLVESGPAGGAVLASSVAADLGLGDILSFDMGGTTAKICLIDAHVPQAARSFEVDRQYHYMKGSGLPLRIPVIEMVEIGAGGGSIAAVDDLRRLSVGPESAGSTPGPACYDRGGQRPTVTDANLILGKLDPQAFAGGTIALSVAAAERAIARDVGAPLGLGLGSACHGVAEIVEENMANAARRHAVESGKLLDQRTLVAFGGSAPLHAARLAEKLGIRDVVIPPHAGVGSAVGFLRAPISFEIVRTHVARLSQCDVGAINRLLETMAETARALVRMGAPEEPIAEIGFANMRYAGQGHEIDVQLPPRPLSEDLLADMHARFEQRYAGLFGHVIPGQDLEFVDFAVRAVAQRPQASREAPPEASPAATIATPTGMRALFDAQAGEARPVPFYERDGLAPGAQIDGPAVICEAETTTIVTHSFMASIDASGAIRLTSKRI